jgi:Tol biopolymer transport system component
MLYLLEDNLVAQSFDLARLAVSGEILPVAANVLSIGNQRAGLFTASAGMLLYFSAGSSRARNLVWLDRTGAELGVLAEIGDWYAPRFSPDARSIAIALSDSGSHTTELWVLNAQDGSRTRLTRPVGDVPESGSRPRGAISQPVWSPDGTAVAYLTVKDSQPRIVRRKISSGMAQEEVVYSGAGTPVDFSLDGRFLMIERGNMASADSRSMLWVIPLRGRANPIRCYTFWMAGTSRSWRSFSRITSIRSGWAQSSS